MCARKLTIISAQQRTLVRVEISSTFVEVFVRLRIIGYVFKNLEALRCQTLAPRGETRIKKPNVRTDGAQIQIEVTPVLRGCVYDPEVRGVSARVEEAFGYAEIQVVSFPDLYGGKIVTALDRQQPRDLFDVRDLLDNEGISDELRRAFIAYLVSSNRPFAEMLAPNRRRRARRRELCRHHRKTVYSRNSLAQSVRRRLGNYWPVRI
jgi:Nucleotidyl transferase AbiEii toxin, Type IV TA system